MVQSLSKLEHPLNEPHGVIISVQYPLVGVPKDLQRQGLLYSFLGLKLTLQTQQSTGRSYMVCKVWRYCSTGVARVQAPVGGVVRVVPPVLSLCLGVTFVLSYH